MREIGPRYDSKPDQPKDTGVVLPDLAEQAMLSKHYDLDDIGECFGRADLLALDALARKGDHTELGRRWAMLTHPFRKSALDTAVYFLSYDEAERHSDGESE